MIDYFVAYIKKIIVDLLRMRLFEPHAKYVYFWQST